jgi:hypothetical protein
MIKDWFSGNTDQKGSGDSLSCVLGMLSSLGVQVPRPT